MILWMSATARGSIPEKGSSSRMNEETGPGPGRFPPAAARRPRGSRRESGPDGDLQLFQNPSCALAGFGVVQVQSLEDGERFSSTVIFRKMEASWGR
jgi:hypothetical protein